MKRKDKIDASNKALKIFREVFGIMVSVTLLRSEHTAQIIIKYGDVQQDVTMSYGEYNLCKISDEIIHKEALCIKAEMSRFWLSNLSNVNPFEVVE